MSKPDAERALSIYKMFAVLTERVMKFLSEARSYESSTGIPIPRIHHAPLSLATHLEEYLNDNDFDINRRQYLTTQEAKRTSKPLPTPGKPAEKSASVSTKPAFPDDGQSQGNKTAQSTGKGPPPDLIDFFESIEQNQQPMAQNATQFQQQAFQPPFTNAPQQQPQPTGFDGFQQQPAPTGFNGFQQSTNPFNQFPQQPTQQQLPVQSTGGGVDAYGSQGPQQIAHDGGFQQQQPQQLQHQSTNPFRQSIMPQTTGQPLNSTQAPPSPMPQLSQSTGTNPFSQQPQSPQLQGGHQPFQQFIQQSQSQFPHSLQQPQAQQQQQQLMPQRTGTNPFARVSPANNVSPSQSPGALVSQATGSTNPFRQSEFVNQQTGSGWQSQQGTMGGLESLETKQVFPRPGHSAQQAPGGWPSF